MESFYIFVDHLDIQKSTLWEASGFSIHLYIIHDVLKNEPFLSLEYIYITTEF